MKMAQLKMFRHIKNNYHIPSYELNLCVRNIEKHSDQIILVVNQIVFSCNYKIAKVTQ